MDVKFISLSDWSVEKFGKELDLLTIDVQQLNDHLKRFYAEVQPKNEDLSGCNEYHKNTLKGIRAALNRHFNDIGREFDIVRDKAFKTANASLDGKLKYNLKSGLSRPTQHKAAAVIEPEDLRKISTYFNSSEDPVILRMHVWYNLSVHFVSRGLEFHQQLSPQIVRVPTCMHAPKRKIFETNRAKIVLKSCKNRVFTIY